jgi:hypothetical protein
MPPFLQEIRDLTHECSAQDTTKVTLQNGGPEKEEPATHHLATGAFAAFVCLHLAEDGSRMRAELSLRKPVTGWICAGWSALPIADTLQ